MEVDKPEMGEGKVPTPFDYLISIMSSLIDEELVTKEDLLQMAVNERDSYVSLIEELTNAINQT